MSFADPISCNLNDNVVRQTPLDFYVWSFYFIDKVTGYSKL